MENKEKGADLPHNIVLASQQQVALVLMHKTDGRESSTGTPGTVMKER